MGYLGYAENFERVARIFQINWVYLLYFIKLRVSLRFDNSFMTGRGQSSDILVQRGPGHSFKRFKGQNFYWQVIDVLKLISSKIDFKFYLIKRDGVLFRYILDYLRNGSLILPENFQVAADISSHCTVGKNHRALPSLRYPVP